MGRHVRRREGRAPARRRPVTVLGVVLTVTATAVLGLTWPGLERVPAPPPAAAARPAPGPGPPVPTTAAAPAAPAGPAGVPARGSAAETADARPTRVGAAGQMVTRWHAARSRAYTSGSLRRLRALYADGAAGPDLRVLRDYRDRGVRLRSLRVQVLSVAVLRWQPAERLVRVTDRVARAVVVGTQGRPHLLPRDAASTRAVRWLRRAGRWRVVEVRAVSTERRPQRRVSRPDALARRR